jgi:hypothetical protein
MRLTYERRETEEEIVIVHKYWALFYLFFLAAILGVFFLDVWNSRPIPALFVLFVLIFFADNWRPLRETGKAMNEGEVTIYGSKFSLSNPLTVRIKKQGK